MAVSCVFDKLSYLSLVSRICTELENHHVGFGDKVLAELIAETGRNCEAVDDFHRELKQNGVDMPEYLVSTLLTIIHSILPPTKVKIPAMAMMSDSMQTHRDDKSGFRSRTRHRDSQQNRNLPIYKLKKTTDSSCA
ncbi:hypothetical protein M0R45_018966 [Rubus argutus]|uniref:Uncharacterized protein n=1 Tax=Rubus argutus TaxID=59490 RepID=A0AAW1X5G0_RUBAR